MPRKVTAYECEWNCGKNLRKTKAAVARHEEACLLNPGRLSCVTCVYDGDEGQCVVSRRPEKTHCVVRCYAHQLKDELKEDSNA